VAPSFLTPALSGAEWSASRSSRFIPGELSVGTDAMVGRVGHTVHLGPARDRNWILFSFKAPSIHYTDWACSSCKSDSPPCGEQELADTSLPRAGPRAQAARAAVRRLLRWHTCNRYRITKIFLAAKSNPVIKSDSPVVIE
jgi:hypothetical protein